MYKIEIDWGMRSPFLQVLTGDIRIGSINMGRLDKEIHPSFPVKKEANTTGYQNCPALFGECKSLVDVMVRSYFDGMRLSNHSLEWFDNCHRHNNKVTVNFFD